MEHFWKDAHEVKVKVVEVRGVCTANHKVGDEWILKKLTPPDFCGSAYCSLYPTIQTLVFGGKIPWEKDGEVRVGCSDSKNVVVFSVKALKKE